MFAWDPQPDGKIPVCTADYDYLSDSDLDDDDEEDIDDDGNGSAASGSQLPRSKEQSSPEHSQAEGSLALCCTNVTATRELAEERDGAVLGDSEVALEDTSSILLKVCTL